MADSRITDGPESATDLSASEAVAAAVANAEGETPLELRPPLYEVIDSDALNRLFDPGPPERNGRVVFEYRGYEVTVRADGSVSVADRQ